MCGVVTRTNSIYLAKAVIMYRNIPGWQGIYRRKRVYSGPSGLAPSMELADSCTNGLPDA